LPLDIFSAFFNNLFVLALLSILFAAREIAFPFFLYNIYNNIGIIAAKSNIIFTKMFVKTHSKNVPLLYKRFNGKACVIVVVGSLVTLNNLPPQ
jgi:hypothetical protein